MNILKNVQVEIPELFDPSVSIKVIEVAKKYEAEEGQPITRSPHYTYPGGPNKWHCGAIKKAWTQGFLPGMLWLLVERQSLMPEAIEHPYGKEEIQRLARRWQADFRFMARPSENHDQGFRFQLSYGKDLSLTRSEDAKLVVIEAAESLLDRFDPVVGAIRSWDRLFKADTARRYEMDNMDEHFLVIVDNMMNLDILYLATDLTGDPRYREVANRQAEKSMTTHVRRDFTTYHVVNFDQKTGEVDESITCQGYADESCWSRGQAWACYGYAQCALRTERREFTEIARKLVDVFLARLSPSGVPWWDSDAPKPCAYDCSAGTIAARAMQMLYTLLISSDPDAAEQYLARAFQLIKDVIRECLTPRATLKNGFVNWGEGEWESLLAHSTSNGNSQALKPLVDHGLIYADYYFVEFGNEAIKMQQGLDITVGQV